MEPSHLDPENVDLSAADKSDCLEARLTLSAPRTRLRAKLPSGKAGRAEAVVGGQNWSAKHYWNEADGTVIYEFDESLPVGEVLLRIPFTAS